MCQIFYDCAFKRHKKLSNMCVKFFMTVPYWFMKISVSKTIISNSHTRLTIKDFFTLKGYRPRTNKNGLKKKYS